MNPDERVEDYNRGVRAGMEHANPAPETERRLSALEEAMKNADTYHKNMIVFMAKFEGLPDVVSELSRAVTALTITAESNKSVRNIVYGAVALVLTAVGVAGTALVIK